MNCVHTFGTGRHKRQADRTLLFQYIFSAKLDLNKSKHLMMYNLQQVLGIK